MRKGIQKYWKELSTKIKEDCSYKTKGKEIQNLVGEEVRLKQVLINLIKNALKFTKKGWIKIIVAYDYNEKMLKVHIFDSGKGIKQEELNKLFTKFGKLRRTAEMNSEGIGLGLMICKELVSKN